MKSICWLTEDWALDTDINIVPYLIESKCFNINWYVLTQKKNLIQESKYYKIIFIPYRFRDLRNIANFIEIFRHIRIKQFDIIYSSAMGIPFYYPILLNFKKRNQPLVHAAHNVIPYNVWPISMRLTVKYIFKKNKYFQFFSKFTYNWFNKRYVNKNCFYAPMVIKDYGDVRTNHYAIDKGKVNLLFFGNVAGNKRLDLLINAVKNLPDFIKNKIHLNICGNCKYDKEYFEEAIKGERNISAYFKRIPDDEIPELFTKSSFLVLPYQDVAQSGPHMIAYNYNLPVIASDLEGFSERIENGINGFLFKVNNTNSLINTLVKVASLNENEYLKIKSNLQDYVNKKFSKKSVATEYINYFNNI